MSEHPRNEMSFTPELTKERPRIFDVCPDLEDRAAEFEESLKRKEFSGLIDQLGNAHVMYNMCIAKGKNGEYLKNIVEAVNTVVNEANGFGVSSLRTAEQLLGTIEKTGLNPPAWAMLTSAFFHLRRDAEVEQLSRAMLELPEEVLPSFERATVYNNLASLKNRYGQLAEGQEYNREAMDVMTRQGLDNPESTWLKMKLRHGLLYGRMAKKAHSDMEDQWLAILREREAIGDTHHIGRTYLDLGRCARQLFDKDKAIYYLTKAMELSAQSGYTSSAVQAAKELAQVRETTGEAGRANRVWVKGVEFGEYLGADICEDLEQLRAEQERGLKVPAACLIDLAQDEFLVEIAGTKSGEGFLLPLIDQEKKRDADGEVRKSVQALLQYIIRCAGMSTEADTVELTTKTTYMRFLGKTEDKKYFFYRVMPPPYPSVSRLAAILDKEPIDCYGVMSWQDMQAKSHLFDTQSQVLIQKEQEARIKQSAKQ